MPDADRRLRQVAQLRRLWRAFRDPQERLEDEQVSRPLRSNAARQSGLQESLTPYGHPVIRAAIRHWWTHGDYSAIVELGKQLGRETFETDPLIGIYVDEARARLPQPYPSVPIDTIVTHHKA